MSRVPVWGIPVCFDVSETSKTLAIGSQRFKHPHSFFTSMIRIQGFAKIESRYFVHKFMGGWKALPVEYMKEREDFDPGPIFEYREVFGLTLTSKPGELIGCGRTDEFAEYLEGFRNKHGRAPTGKEVPDKYWEPGVQRGVQRGFIASWNYVTGVRQFLQDQFPHPFLDGKLIGDTEFVACDGTDTLLAVCIRDQLAICRKIKLPNCAIRRILKRENGKIFYVLDGNRRIIAVEIASGKLLRAFLPPNGIEMGERFVSIQYDSLLATDVNGNMGLVWKVN